MNLFSKERAEKYENYSWLCDANLGDWIVKILEAYGESILDVGFGNGFMFDYYKGHFNTSGGIDPDITFSEQNKKTWLAI